MVAGEAVLVLEVEVGGSVVLAVARDVTVLVDVSIDVGEKAVLLPGVVLG